jgi:hypothetical protein
MSRWPVRAAGSRSQGRASGCQIAIGTGSLMPFAPTVRPGVTGPLVRRRRDLRTLSPEGGAMPIPASPGGQAGLSRR